MRIQSTAQKPEGPNGQIHEYEGVYDLLASANLLISSEGSLANMLAGLKKISPVISEQVSREALVFLDKDINEILGLAHVMLLKLDDAREYFASSGNDERLKQLLTLGIVYGKYNLVKAISAYKINRGDLSFSLEEESILSFIRKKAIPNVRIFRQADSFSIDHKSLDYLLSEYELIKGEKTDRKNIVGQIVDEQMAGGSLKAAKNILFAEYAGDDALLADLKKNMDAIKENPRSSLDEKIKRYCSANKLSYKRKMQVGDTDDYFPVSSNIYLADEKKRSIVLKENLRLYVDFTRPGGYSMEKEILEAIRKRPHRSIVNYLGSEKIGNSEFLMLEFFQGESLANYTANAIEKPDKKFGQERKKLDLEESTYVIKELVEALQHLRSLNILYADIKDTNVLFDKKSREIKLIDFGMARLFNEPITDDTVATSVLSTPKYVPPEMAVGFKFSPKSDVFQLGILYYELITGEHPFARYDFIEGEGHRESEIMKYTLPNAICNWKRGNRILEEHKELEELFEGAFKKNPDERLTLEEFNDRLVSISSRNESINNSINPSYTEITYRNAAIDEIITGGAKG